MYYIGVRSTKLVYPKEMEKEEKGLSENDNQD